MQYILRTMVPAMSCTSRNKKITTAMVFFNNSIVMSHFRINFDDKCNSTERPSAIDFCPSMSLKNNKQQKVIFDRQMKLACELIHDQIDYFSIMKEYSDLTLNRVVWAVNNKPHRSDGPGVIIYGKKRQTRQWYLNGYRISVDEIRDVTGLKGRIPDQFSKADQVALKLAYCG